MIEMCLEMGVECNPVQLLVGLGICIGVPVGFILLLLALSNNWAARMGRDGEIHFKAPWDWGPDE